MPYDFPWWAVGLVIFAVVVLAGIIYIVYRLESEDEL